MLINSRAGVAVLSRNSGVIPGARSAKENSTRATKRIRTAALKSVSFFHYQKVILLLTLLTLISLVTRVYFSNQLAVSGAAVSYSNSKLADLKQENSDLENALSQKSSLSYIEAKATSLGFVKIGKVQVIEAPANVALNQ